MTCKDCISEGVTTSRPAPHPGPRCVTHNRARKKALRKLAHERRLLAVYNITPEQYWALYEAQGGKCYICERAKGLKRNLAVDHNHGCCAGKTSCGKCVRALLCSPCNDMLAHARDDWKMFERAISHLKRPIAPEVFLGMD